MNIARPLRLLMAIASFAVAGMALRGYITDDTFIHLRYATNLIEHGEFSFNPGQDTYGATSVIWVLGLALLLKLGVPALYAAWALGAVCGLGVILVADAIVARLTFGERWKTLVLLLIVGDVWFVRWSYSGMETPLATGVLLLGLWPLFADRDLAWLKTDQKLWPRFLAWGVAAGLAGLVRPEFLLVVPVALPTLLWFEYFRAGSVGGVGGRHRARPHGPIVAAVSGWLVVVAPWLVYAWFTFGRVIPETAAAKSAEFTISPYAVLANLASSVGHLAAVQGILWVGMVILIILVLVRHQTATYDAPEAAVDRDGSGADAPVAFGGAWSVWGPIALVMITVSWTAVLLGGFAVKQVWVISRYVSPLAPVLIVAMSVVAEWLMRSSAMRRRTRVAGRWIIVVSATLTLGVNAWIFTTMVVPHARAFSQDVQDCYLDMGIRLAATTPPDAVVAALDIGAVGYASNRKVVDLMGLVSPEILELGRKEGFQEMVADGSWIPIAAAEAPAGHLYFLDRTEEGPRWADRTVAGYRFELLETCQLRGVGLREPQPWTVALYRLVYSETGDRSSDGG